MSKRYRLSIGQIHRIALVDKGDNPAADVVIHKRAPANHAVEKTLPGDVTMAEATKVEAAAEAVTKADLETLQKRAEDAEKRAVDADARVAKLEESREIGEYITKAQVFKDLPGFTAADFGPVLRKVAHAVSPEEYSKLEGVLKGAAEAIRSGALFQEIGNAGPADGSAEAQLAKSADELRKADPQLTVEQALAKAYRANPELRSQAEADERAARNAKVR